MMDTRSTPTLRSDTGSQQEPTLILDRVVFSTNRLRNRPTALLLSLQLLLQHELLL
jgi:hypothetical protein